MKPDEFYNPLTPEYVAAASDALDEYQAQQRPWWLRVFDLPCFVVLAAGQVVRRRWAEWRTNP